MESQQIFLRWSIKISKVVAYLSVSLGTVGALVIIFGQTPAANKWASLGVFLAGVIYFLVFYFLSEIVRILIMIHQSIQRIEASSNQTLKRDIR